jgi:hypothetical protein
VDYAAPTSVAALPASNTSLTNDVSSIDDDLIYFIEVVAPDDGCTATDLKASTLNTTRSNRKSKLKGTGFESLYEMYDLRIYPNPGNGIFNLEMELPGTEDIQLRVFDISGKLISVREFNNQYDAFETVIDLKDRSDGMYQIQIKTDNALMQRVLIKQ